MASALFEDRQISRALLRERAYNHRWAETGHGVIPLTAADPDFAVAPEIRQAISRYTDEGIFSYGPARGLPELRSALVEDLSSHGYAGLDPDRILPLDGAASSMHAVARAFLAEGDEMIVLDPVDFLFEEAARHAGAQVRRCPYDPATGRFPLETLETLISHRTRMIGICNPHNPLGRLMRKDELEGVARFAEEHDLWILNDEVWREIVFPPHQFSSFHHLPAPLRRRVISVHGFSKSHGLAGLRIGTIASPDPETHAAILEASGVLTTAGGASTLSQIAATAALKECRGWVDAFILHLAGLRDLAVERLNAMPGIRCERPEATFLLFPDIRGTGLEAEALTDFLARKARVAVIPGTPRFFGPGAAGHIRLSFATSEKLLERALDRMERALKQLASAPR